MDFCIEGSSCWNSDEFQDKFIRDYFGTNSQKEPSNRGRNSKKNKRTPNEKKVDASSPEKTTVSNKSLIENNISNKKKNKKRKRKRANHTVEEDTSSSVPRIESSTNINCSKSERICDDSDNVSLEHKIKPNCEKSAKNRKKRRFNGDSIQDTLISSSTKIAGLKTKWKNKTDNHNQQQASSATVNSKPNSELDKNEKLSNKSRKRKRQSKFVDVLPEYESTNVSSAVSFEESKLKGNSIDRTLTNSVNSNDKGENHSFPGKKKLKNLKSMLKLQFNAAKKDEPSNIVPVQENNIKITNKDKRKFYNILSSVPISCRSNLLKEKAQKMLQAAKFRMLNEKLYTGSGKDAMAYFQTDTEAYKEYHKGYELQVSKWPINPVDLLIEDIQKMPKSKVIADLGCGNAKIASTFPERTVHSFDLVALNEHVTACDISKVPLRNRAVDIAIFCLSLMGTNLNEYIIEAHRILKPGGMLKIAEVESRIEDVNDFVQSIEAYGFQLLEKDVSHKMFVLLNFCKVDIKLKKEKLPVIGLSPCLYKKR